MITATLFQKIIIDGLLAIVLLAIMALVYRRRLRVSQGVVWSVLIIIALVIITVPGLLDLVSRLMGVATGISALTILGFLGLVLTIVIQAVKIAELDKRLTDLVRQIAIKERKRNE